MTERVNSNNCSHCNPAEPGAGLGGLSHGAVFTELRNQEADVPGEDLVSPARFPFTVCRFSSLFRGLPLISSTWRNLEPVTRAGDSTQQAHSPCSLDNSWLYLRETPSCVCVCVHSLCSLDNSRLYLRETPSRVCVCVCVCVYLAASGLSCGIQAL